MGSSAKLRTQHKNMVLNTVSKKQETVLNSSVIRIIEYIKETYNISVIHKKEVNLTTIIKLLQVHYPNEAYTEVLSSSTMKPDGGILYLSSLDFPILISEDKKQGTNELIIASGGKKQAKGNAVERLGKNFIGFDSWFLVFDILPFICFGSGCDFDEGSSILDRVSTISRYLPLNTIHVKKDTLGRAGSFFFRKDPWTEDEIFNALQQIVDQSINYYFTKYGKETFYKTP